MGAIYLIVQWRGTGVPFHVEVSLPVASHGLQRFLDTQESAPFEVQAITLFRVNNGRVEPLFKLERDPKTGNFVENEYSSFHLSVPVEG